MALGHELVSQLRDPDLGEDRRLRVLEQFARETGWRPSYEIDYPATRELACGHLLVEHGLRPVVAITFLMRNRFFDSLDAPEVSALLSISYNNLVDWHYFPDENGFWWVYNRTRPFTKRYVLLAEHPNAWQVEEFDKLVGRRPSPNLPALDAALVNTVSHWKRVLAGELQATDITQPISELFNAIFFVRATEDQRRKDIPNDKRLLLDEADKNGTPPRTIRAILAAARKKFTSAPASLREDLWDEESLATFDSLHPSTVRSLLSDFYDNRFAPFKYDFSLISKHALSCIYEHYISQLKTTVPYQPLLFPEPADEIPNRELGGYYTPQYIAGFFARFLATAYTGPRFRLLRAVDPACGSGMFLRILLEMQCDPLHRIDVKEVAKTAFGNVLGIDVQPNACKAARLSLSLLYLVLTGDFPKRLEVINDEATSYVSSHPELQSSFDVVIANPPFVKWENIPQAWQSRVATLLAGYDAPKADLYMAFVKMGLDLVRPGGHLLYVLPHTFLLSKNAEKLRGELVSSCWVRFLGDLSEIDVFDEPSSYPILLIVQKKPEPPTSEPQAIVVRCAAYPGHALEEALAGRLAENGYYSIYQVGQNAFQHSIWRVAEPRDRRLEERILRFPSLETFAMLKQGFITGQDRVFIRRKSDVPRGEEGAYIPYLGDREMRMFSVPQETDEVVFYPFAGENAITDDQVKSMFPKTWEHLLAHEQQLKARKSLSRVGKHLWWRPLWPRPPKYMLRPKIVSPHLILFPRFALDAAGKYGVSRGPIILAKDKSSDINVLKYLLGVLNSTVGHWQIVRQSHKYQRGYAMLEVNTLLGFSIPSPAMIPPGAMNSIQQAVDRLIREPSDEETLRVLNLLVAEMYGVSIEDLQEIVLGAGNNAGANESEQDHRKQSD